MKNLHILPTEKPSRLVLDTVNKNLFLTTTKDFGTKIMQFQYIYITSDEDINENDYIITQDNRLVQVSYLLSKDLEGASKVILTTDQDLIKDGVQVIDDEFLEWFGKNPSCEFVDISTYHIKGDISGDLYYKIIIPQEQPKQLTDLEIALKLEQIEREEPKQDTVGKEFYESADKTITVYRQETVEEADELVDLCNKINFVNPRERVAYYNGLKNGAKWQAKQMYSEEEVFNLCRDFAIFVQQKRPSYKNQLEWFEQFKKK